MLEKVAFWDSSVLVPLCITELQSAQAESWFAQFKTAIWWATPVEMIGALCRAERAGRISSAEYRQAKAKVHAIEGESQIVLPGRKLQSQAYAMLERFQLRAADSLQLAAAMAWCEESPRDNVFLSFDDRLREAAEALGFAVA
jgi:predicted nucleic acid-binding protein